jgi:hypothetical protein
MPIGVHYSTKEAMAVTRAPLWWIQKHALMYSLGSHNNERGQGSRRYYTYHELSFLRQMYVMKSRHQAELKELEQWLNSPLTLPEKN